MKFWLIILRGGNPLIDKIMRIPWDEIAGGGGRSSNDTKIRLSAYVGFFSNSIFLGFLTYLLFKYCASYDTNRPSACRIFFNSLYK